MFGKLLESTQVLLTNLSLVVCCTNRGIMITALYILVPGSRILTDGFGVFIEGSELFVVNFTKSHLAQISVSDAFGTGFTVGLINIVSCLFIRSLCKSES